jgi:hypothetical protein
MEKLINNHVIFAIDTGHDLHTHAKFMRYLDTKNVLEPLRYTPKLCVGAWDNQVEYSFMMDYNDYYKWVHDAGWVDRQECIMIMNPVNPRHTTRYQATFRTRFDWEEDNYAGELIVKDLSEILRDKDEDWTAIMGTNQFYVLK